MHQSAAVCAGSQRVLSVGVLPVHQHPQGLTHIGGVLFGGDLILQGHQTLEVPVFLLFAHGVGQHRRRRPLTGGVDEGKEGVVAHLRQEREGVLKLLGGLAGKAHDDVRGQYDVGHQFSQPPNLVQIGRPVVMAVHGFQDPVVTRLHGKVELRGHLLASRHRLKELLRGVLGVAGHEADQEVAGDGVDHLQEVCKVNVQSQILAVGVDVLPQEGDVLAALRR